VTLEAIVVLGCRIGPGGRLGAAANRRVVCGAAAWQDNRDGIVLVSGGRRWHGIAEATTMRHALLTAHGVPERAIVAECCSLSTAENARYSTRLLRILGLQRVAVVTCDWHLGRALNSFRTAGIMAEGLPVPSPPVNTARAAWRHAREAGAGVLDRWATWGWRSG
jgi:uncharacterized SAM-binding protein YcdF (DUF218 family)